MRRPHLRLLVLAAACASPMLGCGGDTVPTDTGPYDSGNHSTDGGDAARDTGATTDSGATDSGHDAGAADSGLDAGGTDSAVDAGSADTGNDAGGTDSGRLDAGAMDSGVDSGHDAGTAEAGAVDAGPASDVPRADVVLPDVTVMMGRCTPVIDGHIGTTSAEWSNAWSASNTVPTAWGVGLNDLQAIHVCYDANNLYFGIQGNVETSNAIVLYLDKDYGPPATGVTSPTGLMDHAGAPGAADPLDPAISAAFTSWPSAFGADWAWGTRTMAVDKVYGATANNVGLREVDSSPTDFNWNGDDHTVCTALGHACEVQIPWSTLYAQPMGTMLTGAHRLALFVRINNGDGTMSSNQTLPMDNALLPRTITNLLQFSVTP